ncbi:hypothetical protein TURU_102684 [Turdus rufiventris]|nr:hypothetical protein TURU_102684 [Turdus rufiventris]
MSFRVNSQQVFEPKQVQRGPEQESCESPFNTWQEWEQQEAVLDNPSSEGISPNMQSKHSLEYLEAISSSVACYLGKETDTYLATTSFQAAAESGKDFGKRPIDSCRDLTHVKLFYSAEPLKQDDGAMLCLILTLVQIPLGMGHGVFETRWEVLLVTCLDAGADPILGDVNSATQF